MHGGNSVEARHLGQVVTRCKFGG